MDFYDSGHDSVLCPPFSFVFVVVGGLCRSVFSFSFFILTSKIPYLLLLLFLPPCIYIYLDGIFFVEEGEVYRLGERRWKLPVLFKHRIPLRSN